MTLPRPARTVLIAPDKFKGSLSAAEVTAALARGISHRAPDTTVLSCPIADGGDGTIDAALAAGSTPHEATVTGPTGEARSARYALAGDVAVVELAETVGLAALPGGHLAPHTASTRGLGELIAAAVAGGARTIVVGLGGSSSTDAGTGLLQGLGARLLTVQGQQIAPGTQGLAQLASVDLAPALATLDGVTLIAANDVTNLLLGPDGAAAVYGPQKGLPDSEVAQVDARLSCVAGLLDPAGSHRDRQGAGAAGGTGFALFLLGAQQRSGADAVLELAGFDPLLARADLVVTGEGQLDEQTLQGKGPAEVARRAQAAGLPVAAVAGALALDAAALAQVGIQHAWELMSKVTSVEEAIARAEDLLVEIGKELAAELLSGSPT